MSEQDKTKQSEDYFDELLAGALRNRRDEGLMHFSAADMAAKVESTLAEEKRKAETINYPSLLLRKIIPAAALIALGMLVGSLFFTHSQTSAVVDNYPYYVGQSGAVEPHSLDGRASVPTELLKWVSRGQDNAGEKIEDAYELALADIESITATINSRVSHVWEMAANPEETVAIINELCREAGIPEDAFALTVSGHKVKMNARATKQQLVNFVTFAARRGAELFSAAQPQPEQKEFFGKGSDMVTYDAIFVTN